MTATTGATRRGTAETSGPTLLDRLPATTWVDVAVLTGLALLAVVGFEPAFGHYAFAQAAVGGIVVGGGIALLGRLFRLSWPLAVVLALAGYFLFGTPLALPGQALYGVLPSLDSLSGLVLGAVFGWSDAVTLQAPLEAPPYVAVVPYVAGWLVSLVSVTLAVRWLPGIRRPSAGRAALLLAGPAVLLLAAILLGTRDPFFAGVRGVLFAAVSLVWLSWRRGRFARDRVETDSAVRRSRLLGGAAVVLGAVLVGALAGSVLAPPASSRFVVRDEITPPFDPSTTRARSPASANTRKTCRRRSFSPSPGCERARWSGSRRWTRTTAWCGRSPHPAATRTRPAPSSCSAAPSRSPRCSPRAPRRPRRSTCSATRTSGCRPSVTRTG
ncbi:hypothetical protein [Leifsonia xyli]|uniref:hypothetical protein n=1 Tax=Leifsonia xyli TaxID=1575 RepID=UPI003D66F681